MFKVIVPCYNAAEYIKDCLASLLGQTWNDYQAIIVNDASTDGTVELAKSLVGSDPRFTIITTDANKGPLASIVEGIKWIRGNPEDVVAIVDGDDHLIGSSALDFVAHTYKRCNTWMTYGSYRAISGKLLNPDIGKRYDVSTICDSKYRDVAWRASHLKTFKKHLWDRVMDQDLRDADGEYWRVTGDMAIMFPMLEMAADRQEAISDYIYMYRDNIPSNEHNIHPQQQLDVDRRIRSMHRYPAL